MEKEIDLNIENYDLDDLLKLFHLNYNFSNGDVKGAKKMVLRLHPDKSGLDKQYFLFFCKAYRIIESINNHRFKSQNKSGTDYTADYDRNKHELVKDLLKKDKLDFANWFNKEFEKINVVDHENEKGYGDWFKSEDDIDKTQTSRNMMNQKIMEKKERMSGLIRREEIRDFNDNQNNFKALDGSAPDLYSSDIFDKLKYEDLKKAHTETVIPVGESDYQNIKKFNNVETFRTFRNQQDIKPMNEQNTEKYFNNRERRENTDGVNLAYKLAKQDEQMEKINNSWWKNLRLLQ